MTCAYIAVAGDKAKHIYVSSDSGLACSGDQLVDIKELVSSGYFLLVSH